MLIWQTTSEENNDYFHVQRLLDNQHPELSEWWQVVVKVKGKGTTNSISNYQFTDASAALSITKTIYYRLKQIDFDGKFEYSKTVAVNLTKDENISVYPNPFNDEIIISIPQSTILTIAIGTQLLVLEIFDITARKVYETELKNSLQLAVSNTIHTSQLKNGVYFLKIGEKVFKLIKQ